MKKNIGVLALQGAFLEHEQTLRKLGVSCFEIRQSKDLEQSMDGLILPGGESTTMRRLLHDLGLFEPLRARIVDGMPVLGTCAGLILLAKRVEGGIPCFATMDITAHRNAYGRQLGSFHTTAAVKGLGEVPMTFIRAPYIVEPGSEVEVLAVVDGRIVAAREANQLAVAFHPELTDCTTLHELFLQMVYR